MIRSVRIGQACYHVFHAVPSMVAREMNFFLDEGLVKQSGQPAFETLPGGLTPFNVEKISLAQAMKERGVTVATDVKPSTVGYLNRRGAKLRIVAGWLNHQPTWVMSRAEIRDPAELRGRAVGLRDLGGNHYDALAYWLKEAGLDPQRDVSYVRGVWDGQAALRAGDVDAAFLPMSEGPPLLDEGFNLLIDLSTLYPNGRPERVVVATDELIQERPEWVKALVRGLIRTYWFTRTMPDNFRYLNSLERRLRLRPIEDAGIALPNPGTIAGDRRGRMRSFDPEECLVPPLSRTPRHCEELPFPIDGLPSGFDDYVRQCISTGELDEEDVKALEDSLCLDITREAFTELAARPDLQSDLRRVREVAGRVGF
jgi:hypothetical protein